MGNRGKRQRLNQAQRGATQQAPFEALEGLSMEELNALASAAPIALRNRLEKSLNSENFEEVLKAQNFIAQQKGGRKLPQPEIKSILWNPSEIGFQAYPSDSRQDSHTIH